MANGYTSADDFAAELENALTLYAKEISDGIDEATETVGKEISPEIKRHIEFKNRTGKYIKSFRVKIYKGEMGMNKRATWYVAAPEYRKTHLLENGHAKRNGGRTKAYPHIKYGEELAIKRMEELSEKVIKDAGN